MLQKRLSKWLGDFDELAVDNMCERMERVGKAPKLWSTVVSALRIATRGVCTGSRFQKADTRCRFGCGVRPGSVQHFLVCEVVGPACEEVCTWLRWRRRFSVACVMGMTDLLMLGGGAGLEEDICR